MDSGRLRYKHRSSTYVSRTLGESAHMTPSAEAKNTDQITEYTAEVSILEAAKLAREQLPPVSKPTSHKFATPDGSSMPGKGLLSDMVQRPRVVAPPSLPRQQYRQPVAVVPTKKKFFGKGTVLTGVACLVLALGLSAYTVVLKHDDGRQVQVLGVNTGL